MRKPSGSVTRDVHLEPRLALAKAGDSVAFEELLGPNLEPAFRLAMAMLKDRAAAEDAVQEAALKSWRHLGHVRSEAELKPWFLGITANECRNIRRSRWWRVVKSDELPEHIGRSPVHPDTDDRIDLGAALDQLPHRHLLALSLYYLLDLSIEDVAKVLGCSNAAARQRIHRAVDAIRPRLVEVNA